ncbi:MAG: acetyl-CoA carboxylase biotin carboxyl carrier protein [Pedobacter sp.]|jgi:acetyl-CoA carboxylase biotin carboxyl carrier protein|uniref:acetyl-CoA carboxylase biotin carboxyl carrier protein n=1 Tax=Pedobacter sp. TaxID=1411316 RepID=UPI0035671281
MDIKQIQELIKFVSRSGVNEVAIEQENFKITIKTNQAPVYVNAALPAPVAAQSATPAAAVPQAAETKAASTPAAEDTSKYITIKSPMIGTFYRSSSPDKPSFANVGDEVAVGKVVCIIEAMKLFNEIESEVAGRIVKVLVDNASPVEYDQPLFLVEPI